MPENFEIANMWVFFLIPLPLIIYFLLPPVRQKSSALITPNLAKAAEYTGEKPRTSALVKRKNAVLWLGLILIWIFIIGALSSPRLVAKPEMKVKTSRNFLIAADISFSMAEKDWLVNNKRSTRWEGVKSVMHEFIKKREGDRMGLILFGSNAYIQAPFTPDLETVDVMLEEADVGMAGQMTNIGKAIVKGISMFENDTIKTKVMLVLTDGVDGGSEILPLDAANLAKKDSVQIYTIGIGDPSSGNSDLDERTLEEIADMTGGQYFRANDENRLNEIYEELDRLEPIEYEEEEFKPVTLLYHYPLGLALALSIFILSILNLNGLVRKLKTKSHD
ncbi:MAG: magnesium chelatase [Bacteroidetes bacterium MedPE-SWsnd-G2]|nr:MAG: magnesium chelatase [Bacteroidetes bacterium MedPE-SWsnd-G2]